MLPAKKIKVLIGDKAELGVGDEIFYMNGVGSFTNENGVVHPHQSIRNIETDESFDVGGGTIIGGAAVATPDTAVGNNRGGRGGRGGKRPDPLSLMLIHMKEEAQVRADEKEERKLEREERAAERTADNKLWTEMVGAIAGRYFGTEGGKDNKRRKDKRKRKHMKRKKRLGIEDSSSSSSSSCSSYYSDESDLSEECGHKKKKSN